MTSCSTRIDVIQPVLVALAIAYAELLRSVGVKPDAVVGHSMGEVAAACIAGALDLDQAMQVVCARSALMRRVSGQGAMALVDLPMAEVEARLAGRRGSRIGGGEQRSAIQRHLRRARRRSRAVMAGLEQDGVFCRLVKVDVASHSPQMEPLAAELAAALDGLTPAAGCRANLFDSARAPRSRARRSTPAIGHATCGEPVLFGTGSRSAGRGRRDGIPRTRAASDPVAIGAADRAGCDHDRLRTPG